VQSRASLAIKQPMQLHSSRSPPGGTADVNTEDALPPAAAVPLEAPVWLAVAFAAVALRLAVVLAAVLLPPRVALLAVALAVAFEPTSGLSSSITLKPLLLAPVAVASSVALTAVPFTAVELATAVTFSPEVVAFSSALLLTFNAADSCNGALSAVALPVVLVVPPASEPILAGTSSVMPIPVISMSRLSAVTPGPSAGVLAALALAAVALTVVALVAVALTAVALVAVALTAVLFRPSAVLPLAAAAALIALPSAVVLFAPRSGKKPESPAVALLLPVVMLVALLLVAVLFAARSGKNAKLPSPAAAMPFEEVFTVAVLSAVSFCRVLSTVSLPIKGKNVVVPASVPLAVMLLSTRVPLTAVLLPWNAAVSFSAVLLVVTLAAKRVWLAAAVPLVLFKGASVALPSSGSSRVPFTAVALPAAAVTFRTPPPPPMLLLVVLPVVLLLLVLLLLTGPTAVAFTAGRTLAAASFATGSTSGCGDRCTGRCCGGGGEGEGGAGAPGTNGRMTEKSSSANST